jgi:hypothetical protein
MQRIIIWWLVERSRRELKSTGYFIYLVMLKYMLSQGVWVHAMEMNFDFKAIHALTGKHVLWKSVLCLPWSVLLIHSFCNCNRFTHQHHQNYHYTPLCWYPQNKTRKVKINTIWRISPWIHWCLNVTRSCEPHNPNLILTSSTQPCHRAVTATQGCIHCKGLWWWQEIQYRIASHGSSFFPKTCRDDILLKTTINGNSMLPTQKTLQWQMFCNLIFDLAKWIMCLD